MLLLVVCDCADPCPLLGAKREGRSCWGAPFFPVQKPGRKLWWMDNGLWHLWRAHEQRHRRFPREVLVQTSGAEEVLRSYVDASVVADLPRRVDVWQETGRSS